MKTRIIVVLLVLILVLLGFYWLRPLVAPPSIQEKAAKASKPIATTPDRLASAKVATPTMAPATKPSLSAPASPTSANSVSADPQSDLKTAIPDIVAMMREGDFARFYQTYCPPDKFSPIMLQGLQEDQENQAAETDPKMLQIIRETRIMGAQSYEELEQQTPVLNATGDEATFQYRRYTAPGVPDTNSIPRVFIKIDGKWYFNGRF